MGSHATSTGRVGWAAMRLIAVLATAACAAPATAAASGSVSSTFDADADGWTVSGDPTSATPTWFANGGSPNGYIQTTDGAGGEFMYWTAPSKFLGNHLDAYGGALSFDLAQDSSTDHPTDRDDVLLTDGSTTLAYNTPENPGTSFTHYSVPLTETGWKVGSYYPAPGGTNATEAQMKTVLSGLSSLQIRAEYHAGPVADVDGLDNAVITIVDTDGDGIGDPVDTDDDNDGVADASDDCPLGAAAGADTDGDGCKDAEEDSNDDDDALPDSTDRCDLQAADTKTGCPKVGRDLSVSYSKSADRFRGRLTSSALECTLGQKVSVWRVRTGHDEKVGTATTDEGGQYALGDQGRKGSYYSKVSRRVIDEVGDCQPAKSSKLDLG